jgi:hypothetical protein
MKKMTALAREKRDRTLKLLAGDEPSVNLNARYPEVEMSRAYAWYNTNYTVEEGKEWLISYLENKQYSSATINYVKAQQVPMVVCSIARLLSRNITIMEKSLKFFDSYLSNIKENTSSELKVKKVVNYIKPPSVDDKVDLIMTNIEYAFDSLITTWSYNYSLYNDIKASGIKAPTVKEIHTKLQPRIAQIIELMDSGKSSDLHEYYDSYNKTQLKKIAEFHRMLDEDCKKAMQVTKIVRQRKKRTVNATKAVSKLKYKKEDNSLKIVSVNPANILNSSILVTYNTKYKRMTVFVAKEDSKLSVKGTSILNYDETKSMSTRVRKPNEALNAILSGTTNSITKTFDKFKSTVTIPTNRINEETILVRVSHG